MPKVHSRICLKSSKDSIPEPDQSPTNGSGFDSWLRKNLNRFSVVEQLKALNIADQRRHQDRILSHGTGSLPPGFVGRSGGGQAQASGRHRVGACQPGTGRITCSRSDEERVYAANTAVVGTSHIGLECLRSDHRTVFDKEVAMHVGKRIGFMGLGIVFAGYLSGAP